MAGSGDDDAEDRTERMAMVEPARRGFSRRSLLLSSAAILAVASSKLHARVISGVLPWEPNGGNPPVAARPGPWQFFTADEGRAMDALADRIIPPDPPSLSTANSRAPMAHRRGFICGRHLFMAPRIKGISPRPDRASNIAKASPRSIALV
jgi:hypothetical protein